MSGTLYRDEQRLALAVTRFIQEVHHRLSQARLEPMTPYEDEDFTLPSACPLAQTQRWPSTSAWLPVASVEDEMEVYILPRVRVESV